MFVSRQFSGRKIKNKKEILKFEHKHFIFEGVDRNKHHNKNIPKAQAFKFRDYKLNLEIGHKFRGWG